ncbi:MAG: hypothetical protein L6R48_23650 [Planctomycetes bacterium]|nr:hypothetical protein [Planctomycetota bacterium]
MEALRTIFTALCFGDPAAGGTIVALHVPRLDTPLGQVACTLGLALVAAFIWACYRREASWLTPWRRRQLAGLRLGAAMVLLAIASGAWLELAREDGNRAALLVLVDRSASMALADRRSDPGERAALAALTGGEAEPTRDRLLRAVAAAPAADPLRELAKRYRLEGYGFGAGAALTPFALGDAGAALDAMPAPDGDATRLGDALRDAARRCAGRRVAGVLLLTDGNGNLGEDPLEAVRDLGVPLHAAGVGAPRSRDLEVAFVFCEEVVFKNDRFPVEVRLRQRGYDAAGLSVPLVITRTDESGRSEVVREEQVAFAGAAEVTRTIEVVPDREGVFTYAAEVPVQADEPNPRNNRRARPGVRVVDRRLRLLMADRSPRWEWRFAKGVVDADRQRIAPAYLLQQGDAGERTLRRLPARAADWRGYDAAILGDLDPAAIAPDELAALEEWVKVQGGGLLVVAGRQGMPGSFAGTPLAAMLPVECPAQPPVRAADEQGASLRQAVRPLVAAEGEGHALLRLAADPAADRKAWAEAEGFAWIQPVRRLKRGATALLVHPSLRAGDEPMPLLAIHRYGRGQVAFLASDETWRWRSHPGAAEHRRFWGQMVATLGLAHLLGNAARVQVETARSDYAVGERVEVVARVLDQALEPLRAASVPLTIERDLARTRLVLNARPGQPGVFSGEWVADVPGVHRLAVEGVADGPGDQAERRLTVGEARRELDDAGCRSDLLGRLAAAGGGAYRPVERARELVEQITAKARAADRLREERPVWNAPGLLVLLALLLGLEWFLRKRSDLL